MWRHQRELGRQVPQLRDLKQLNQTPLAVNINVVRVSNNPSPDEGSMF